MRIRALRTFTHAAPDGMVVLNAAKGDEKAGEAEVPDAIAEDYIAAGLATAVTGGKSQLDHDGDGAPGGSLPGDQSTAAKGKRAKAAESGGAPVAAADDAPPV